MISQDCRAKGASFCVAVRQAQDLLSVTYHSHLDYALLLRKPQNDVSNGGSDLQLFVHPYVSRLALMVILASIHGIVLFYI